MSESITRARYYSRMRPLYPGAFPKGADVPTVIAVTNFDEKQFCPEIGAEAWGYIDYEKALTVSVAESYELTPAQEVRK